MYADIKINQQETNSFGIPEWDLELEDNGIALTIDEEGAFQRAILGAFLIKGTIPYLTEAGVEWSYLLAPPSESDRLDTDDITQQIVLIYSAQEVPQYYPILAYDYLNGKPFLRVSVTNGENRQATTTMI